MRGAPTALALLLWCGPAVGAPDQRSGPRLDEQPEQHQAAPVQSRRTVRPLSPLGAVPVQAQEGPTRRLRAVADASPIQAVRREADGVAAPRVAVAAAAVSVEPAGTSTKRGARASEVAEATPLVDGAPRPRRRHGAGEPETVLLTLPRGKTTQLTLPGAPRTTLASATAALAAALAASAVPPAALAAAAVPQPSPPALPRPAPEPVSASEGAASPLTTEQPAPPRPVPPAAVTVVLAPPSAVQARVLHTAGLPPALHLPFSDVTAAAILRRGDMLLLAFASAQPLELGALRASPLFAPLEATTLPGGVLLRLPLAPPAGVQARREGPGWVLQFTRGDERRDGQAEPRALVPEPQAGTSPRFLLRAAKPGPTLNLTDPETGLPLLLGTVLEAGQAMALTRRLAEFELLPTLLGLAVMARADSVTLAAQNDRFVVAAAGGAQLALDPAVFSADARVLGLTRSFELPTASAPLLLALFRAQQARLASAAPLARGPARREAAETLLALGLGQEVQGMAWMAMTEDPAAAADPRTIALAAAGALLAGRLAEARPLRDAALPDSDELTLWRAALAMLEQQPRRAATGFAASLPLLLTYPAALRDRLMPLAAEALAEAGDLASLTELLAAEPNGLALPRALLLLATGKPAEALAAFQAVAASSDRRARAIALRQGIELQLASGALDAIAAARAMEASVFAWRGDEVEIATRRRAAALRMQAKQPRLALALLQETAVLFPDQATALRPTMVDALLAALGEEPPLAAVTLHDAHAELLQADARAEEAALLLAERLVALDLTERAAILLARAADQATEPVRRAALGLRLAVLKLDEGNAAAALAALESTRADALPEALSRERVVLAARAEARRGNLAHAVSGLEALGVAGAASLSELLAEAQDWPAAAAAGARALTGLPAELATAGQRMVLRQAALLVLAGDEAGLAALRRSHASRLPAGPLAEGFAALTAASLHGLADLPRLAREQQLFRKLPGRLEALRAGGPVTR